MRYLICYDIPETRRRTRVAKVIEQRGFRVQWSVFECELTLPLLKELCEGLEEIIDPAEDSIRMYPLCLTCNRGVRSLGLPDPYGLEREVFLF